MVFFSASNIADFLEENYQLALLQTQIFGRNAPAPRYKILGSTVILVYLLVQELVAITNYQLLTVGIQEQLLA